MRVSTLLEGPHVLLSGWWEDGLCVCSLLRCNMEEVSPAPPLFVKITKTWCEGWFFRLTLLDLFPPCRLLHSCHDDASRFIYLLAKPSCNYLEQEDFIPLLQVRLSASNITRPLCLPQSKTNILGCLMSPVCLLRTSWILILASRFWRMHQSFIPDT